MLEHLKDPILKSKRRHGLKMIDKKFDASKVKTKVLDNIKN